MNGAQIAHRSLSDVDSAALITNEGVYAMHNGSMHELTLEACQEMSCGDTGSLVLPVYMPVRPSQGLE